MTMYTNLNCGARGAQEMEATALTHCYIAPINTGVTLVVLYHLMLYIVFSYANS